MKPPRPSYMEKELFLDAVREGQIELMRRYVEMGVCVEDSGGEALLLAAERDDAPMVAALLELGYKKSTHCHMLDEALNTAARQGCARVIPLLIGTGAESFDTAASNAAFYGHVEAYKALVEKGYDAKDGFHAVHAAENGHTDMVAYLAARGVEIKDECLLHAAAGGHADTVSWLLYVKKWESDVLGDALARALVDEHESAVKLLERYGAKIPRDELDGCLSQAVGKGNIHAVRWLLDRGADPGPYGGTIWKKSVSKACVDITEMIEMHPPVEETDAAQAERAFLQMFADRGPGDLRKRFPDGRTGFHLAAETDKFVELIAAVARRGKITAEDFLERDDKGVSPLHRLCRTNRAAQAFAPAIWAGNVEEMEKLWRDTPGIFRRKIAPLDQLKSAAKIAQMRRVVPLRPRRP